MKIIFFASMLIFSTAYAKDCEHCALFDWSSYFPLLDIPKWPIEFVEVEKEVYPVNKHASYCTRPVEMIDTIVIHHTETAPSTNALQINDMHQNRGSKKDPWYMIAYSFVVNSPYPGKETPEVKITEGRPMDIVGAHAGANAYVDMTEDQRMMWKQGKILCGKKGKKFKVDYNQVRKGKIKANVTTIGLAVVGNYAPFSKYNLNGYEAGSPILPTKETLKLTAKLSCQLQKRYPGIKYIKWHSLYNATTCPGHLKENIDNIIMMAKGLGCAFQ